MPVRLRLTPATWLIVTTMAVVMVFVAAMLYSGHIAAGIDAMAMDIADNAHPSIRYLSSARTELHQMGDLLVASFLDDRQEAALSREVGAHERGLHQDLEMYAALPFFRSELRQWQAVDLEMREVEAHLDALVRGPKFSEAKGSAERIESTMAAMQRADVALQNLIVFDTNQGSRLSAKIADARSKAQRAAYLLNGLAIALALAMLIVGSNAARQHVRALRQARDAKGEMTRRLQQVAGAALSISERVAHSGQLSDVLQAAVNAALAVAAADLAALGVGTDPAYLFDPFVHAGIGFSRGGRAAPHPSGAFDPVIAHGRTIRVDDLSRAGILNLPDDHPPVGPFLGVPLRHGCQTVGLLYVGRSVGAAPFTRQDARAIELLAAFTATAMHSSQLNVALQREVRAREDLLSIVSHDLRSPLSAISITAALLSQELANDRLLREQAELITRNTARMTHLAADLLTAAKMQEGRLAIDPAAHDAAAMIADVMDQFAAAATGKGIDLRVALVQPIPPVYCDRERIVQVLSNLIGNALKFTSRGGSVVVSAEPQESTKEICFSVLDRGSGIAEDAIAHVFDRYWQTQEHASRGTGLGLFIAKGIVESHRGRIWVTSRPGQGSNFRFTLPTVEGLTASPDDRRRSADGGNALVERLPLPLGHLAH